MALFNKGETITMDYKDFGQTLPVYVKDINVEENDKVLFEVRKNPYGTSLLSKEFSNLSTNPSSFDFFISFTRDEALSLPAGNYIYYMRLLRENELRDTLVSGAPFIVRQAD